MTPTETPARLTAEQIAELRKLISDATPGTWKYDPSRGQNVRSRTYGPGAAVVVDSDLNPGGVVVVADWTLKKENAALIAALLNAAPALLAAAEELDRAEAKLAIAENWLSRLKPAPRRMALAALAAAEISALSAQKDQP